MENWICMTMLVHGIEQEMLGNDLAGEILWGIGEWLLTDIMFDAAAMCQNNFSGSLCHWRHKIAFNQNSAMIVAPKSKPIQLANLLTFRCVTYIPNLFPSFNVS